MADDRIPDLLGALGEGPVPPLAPAELVRARGERRRRRTQVALACALVLAVAGTGAAATTLLGGQPRDELGFAGDPTPTPTPSETVFYCASYEPVRDADDLCPEILPTPPPPAPVDPSPPPPEATPAPWSTSAAFLSPDAAAQVEEPGWTVDDDHQASGVPLLDPCADKAFMGDPVAQEERAMGSTREAGGSRLVQQVLRFASTTEAAAAFDGFAEDVDTCPEAPAVEGEGVFRFEAAGSGSVDGARTLLVQLEPCDDQGSCTAQFRAYLMLVQSGDGLTLASYGLGEDGDPFEPAARLLDEVAYQLNRAVAGPN